MKAVSTFLEECRNKITGEPQREQIREMRKEFIEANEILGGPPFYTQQVMKSLIELSLEEADLIDTFDPDLLIVSKLQYRALTNVPNSVPLDPHKAADMIPGADVQGLQAIQPPMNMRVGDYHIQLTYSDSTDRMILVDSSKL